MGFKDLFIERQPEETREFVPESTYQIPEAELPKEATNDFIQGVYDANNLNDLSQSIYKVEDLVATLPIEMSDTTKRQTVLSIMSTVGLSPQHVIDDGFNRLQIIQSAADKVVSLSEEEIESDQITIESLKSQIEDLQKTISTKSEHIRSIKSDAEAESTKIESLVKFIQGDK